MMQDENWAEFLSESPILIDCRNAKELQENGSIKGALHFPFALGNAAELATEQIKDKTKPILVFCAVGGRANKLKNQLISAGFQHVRNAGGYPDIAPLLSS
mmetsp:Transcript_18029/g.23514  ORF Transcript_18029/g.23514 Transcript_18029/m.23514 type:complete len:101 (-) Transcript_18029:255-557(-)